MRFAKRMDMFGEGVFTRLASYRREREEAGKQVVDFSIGAPNIPPAPHIIEAITEAAADSSNYVYAITDKKDMLDAVSEWYKRRYGVELDPSTQITSLLGSQDGLAHLSMCFADPGDVVMVPGIAYPIFADGPKLAGAELYYMPMYPEKNYVIDFNDIPEDVARRAKFMIVSYPNNPTSVMAPESFYDELVAFAKKYDIAVLHDNAYSELTFDGRKGGSFLSHEGAMDIGVEFNSLSKTYGTAGARIGFCVGNAEIVSMLKNLKSNIDYGMYLPLQKAAVAAITGDQSCVEANRAEYEHRRDYLCEGMAKAGWELRKSEGTMFVWAKIPDGFSSSVDFALELIKETGVIVTPGSAFGEAGEGYVRMALVRTDEEMDAAFKAVEESGIMKR